MVRSLVFVVAFALQLGLVACPAAAEDPPLNVRPTDPPPMEGRPRAVVAPLQSLPSTATLPGSGGGEDHQVNDRPSNDEAFTALICTVMLVFGWSELGGVRPVTVNAYVSAGQPGPK